jgi:hypothetical protein
MENCGFNTLQRRTDVASGEIRKKSTTEAQRTQRNTQRKDSALPETDRATYFFLSVKTLCSPCLWGGSSLHRIVPQTGYNPDHAGQGGIVEKFQSSPDPQVVLCWVPERTWFFD